MAISHLGSIAGTGNTTTTLTITINVATAAGDIILVSTTNGGSDSSPAVAGTVVSTGGVAAFASVVELNGGASTDLNGKLWWTRAVGNHNTQTVAITGATDSVAGNVTILRDCVASGLPYRATNSALVLGSAADTMSAVDASGVSGCWLVLALCCDDNIADASQAATDPTVITERADHSSGGGADTNNSISAAAMSGTGSTGAITWANARGATIYQISLAAIIAPSGVNTPTAGHASGTGVAREPDAAVTVNAGHASATGVAQPPSLNLITPSGKIETLVDAFATFGYPWDNDNAADASVVGGQLILAPGGFVEGDDFVTLSNPGANNGFAVDVWDLTESHILCEFVPDDPSDIEEAEFGVFSWLGTGAAVFTVTSGNLVAQTQNGWGAETVLNTDPYNATNHRWLRISLAGSTLTFATAPDGVTWTTFATDTLDAGDLTEAAQGAPYFSNGHASDLIVDNVNNPPAATNAPAGHASATGQAFDPTVQISDTGDAGHASATGLARDATALVTDEFVMPRATAAAHDVTATLTVNAGHASAAGTAFDATISTTTNDVEADAGHASATGTANAASVALGSSAGTGSASGAAGGPTSAVGAGAGNATASGAANAGSGALTVSAGHASAAGAAFDATISTTTDTEAQAGHASATGTAGQVSAALTSSAGQGIASGAAGGPASSVGAGAGSAAATASAFDATVSTFSNVEATAGHASATASAGAATVALTVTTDLANATGEAFSPAVGLAVLAGLAIALGQAYDVTALAVETGSPGCVTLTIEDVGTVTLAITDSDAVTLALSTLDAAAIVVTDRDLVELFVTDRDAMTLVLEDC